VRPTGLKIYGVSAALLSIVVGAVIAASSQATVIAHAPAARPRAAYTLPAIKHVWTIVLENQEGAEWQLLGKRYAPYLATTLISDGALAENYYGVGHDSLDNYIAMVSGQPPTKDTKADCTMADPPELPTKAGADNIAQGAGCVYPANFLTVADQLAGAGDTWRAYEEGIPSPCSLLSGSGEYARKHNPFVFFMSLRDDGQCAANDVSLNQLKTDLQTVTTTPNYSYITPDLCDDAHTACGTSNQNPLQQEIDELGQANTFLKKWVPRILASPAFKLNGLLSIVWDEGVTPESCCGEVERDPDGSTAGSQEGIGGAGGGQTGAIFISPFIKPGTRSSRPYNHYSYLKTIENLFGLSYLGYANGPKAAPLGADIFTNPHGGGSVSTSTCSSKPEVRGIGAHHTATRLLLSGEALNVPSCASSAPIASVSVAVALRSGKRCRFISRKGALTAIRACDRPLFLTASGTANWRLTLAAHTRAGRYVVLAQALSGGVRGPLRMATFSER
jgi:phosphatidylinositol-3-phosphatase